MGLARPARLWRVPHPAPQNISNTWAGLDYLPEKVYNQDKQKSSPPETFCMADSEGLFRPKG